MIDESLLARVSSLSPADRLELIGKVWDTLSPDDLPVTLPTPWPPSLKSKSSRSIYLSRTAPSSPPNLLDSLPGVLSDEDEGIAEALRRDAEIDADPIRAINLAQLDSKIQSRRR